MIHSRSIVLAIICLTVGTRAMQWWAPPYTAMKYKEDHQDRYTTGQDIEARWPGAPETMRFHWFKATFLRMDSIYYVIKYDKAITETHNKADPDKEYCVVESRVRFRFSDDTQNGPPPTNIEEYNKLEKEAKHLATYLDGVHEHINKLEAEAEDEIMNMLPGNVMSAGRNFGDNLREVKNMAEPSRRRYIVVMKSLGRWLEHGDKIDVMDYNGKWSQATYNHRIEGKYNLDRQSHSIRKQNHPATVETIIDSKCIRQFLKGPFIADNEEYTIEQRVEVLYESKWDPATYVGVSKEIVGRHEIIFDDTPRDRKSVV